MQSSLCEDGAMCHRSVFLRTLLFCILVVVGGVSAPPHADGAPLLASAEHALKPKDSFKECEQCPEMVVVPAGSFTMSSPQSEPKREPFEGQQHLVTISFSFAVGSFAVTFDEWDACVADGGCNGYKPNDQGRVAAGYRSSMSLGTMPRLM
jgi:formylglycine-generating enzyme required for sulfatase activity